MEGNKKPECLHLVQDLTPSGQNRTGPYLFLFSQPQIRNLFYSVSVAKTKYLTLGHL
jgi:hypothetical protein